MKRNWNERWAGRELLDEEGIPFADLAQNLAELHSINSWLGGHAITLRGLRTILRSRPQQRHWTIAEIGCGGGDNLAVVHRFLQRQHISHVLFGVDLKEDCIRYAAARYGAQMPVQWQCCDYRHATWPEPPDIIFSSLFCHHFDDAVLVEQLQWMRRQSACGFFINDLHRHPLAYHSINMLTRLFSHSYLVKNDAPLSVLRGFRKAEWHRLLRDAGVQADVSWQWAFRYLITCIHEQRHGI